MKILVTSSSNQPRPEEFKFTCVKLLLWNFLTMVPIIDRKICLSTFSRLNFRQFRTIFQILILAEKFWKSNRQSNSVPLPPPPQIFCMSTWTDGAALIIRLMFYFPSQAAHFPFIAEGSYSAPRLLFLRWRRLAEYINIRGMTGRVPCLWDAMQRDDWGSALPMGCNAKGWLGECLAYGMQGKGMTGGVPWLWDARQRDDWGSALAVGCKAKGWLGECLGCGMQGKGMTGGVPWLWDARQRDDWGSALAVGCKAKGWLGECLGCGMQGKGMTGGVPWLWDARQRDDWESAFCMEEKSLIRSN